MVCSCAMSSNCVWLQIIICSYVKESTLFFLRSLLRENGWSLRFLRISLKNKLSDRMIKQLLNSVIAKYRDLSVSRRSIIYLSRSACQLQITFFVQPRPIIVNYSFREQLQRSQCTIKVVPTRCSFRQIFFFKSNKITSITNETSTERPMFSLGNNPHFATPSLFCARNDIWETSAEIPYRWRVTTQIWAVLLIGWKSIQSELQLGSG